MSDQEIKQETVDREYPCALCEGTGVDVAVSTEFCCVPCDGTGTLVVLVPVTAREERLREALRQAQRLFPVERREQGCDPLWVAEIKRQVREALTDE